MPSIAAIDCDLVRGVPPEPTERLEIFQSPGVDGYGALKLGTGQSEFDLTAAKYGTLSAVIAWGRSVRALVGTVVSITNDLAEVHENRLIVSASAVEITAARVPGSTTTHRGEVRLRGVRS